MAQTPEEVAAEEAVVAAGEAAEQEAKEKGLSQEDIVKAVEKARTEEKNKLYPQIDALKESIQEIQASLREEREEKARIQREAVEAAEAQRLDKLSAEERTLEAIRKIEEQLTEERTARQKLEEEARTERRNTELAKYRADAIRAAGDEIGPFADFIKGSSETEIDNAVQIAKARAKEFADRIKEEAGANVRGNMPRSTNPDTAAFEEQELADQLNEVDLEKYKTDAKYRETVKNQLASAYARSAGY